jgi:hypothetical protein
METALIILGVLGVVGYFAAKKISAAATQLGQGLAQGLASGVGITSTTITTSSPPNLGQFGLGPNDSLVLNVYPAPAGQVWKFAADTGMNVGAITATSATFMPAPNAPATPMNVYANLVLGAATAAPVSTYTASVTVTPATPAPAQGNVNPPSP